MEPLDRLHDPRVQRAPALSQEASVRDLVHERVLEGVLEIRIEAGLVQELGGLQRFEAAAQGLFGHLGDRLEQGEWHVLAADDRGKLQEALVVGRQTVDARREHRLRGGGDLDRVDLSGEPIGARLRRPAPSFRPGVRTVSSRNDGLPRRTSSPLSGPSPAWSPSSASQQHLGALREQPVQTNLTVVSFAAPGVLVFGAIGHEQQQARRAEAVDERVEDRLRLAVDPVEILEDDDERLLARLPQQEPSHGIVGALAALLGAQRLPRPSVAGTSNRARSAGSAGSRARSRANTRSVTLARISRQVGAIPDLEESLRRSTSAR